MSPDQIAALGAFLSGLGAALSSFWAVRRMKRNAKKECDDRMAEWLRAFHEGYETDHRDSG